MKMFLTRRHVIAMAASILPMLAVPAFAADTIKVAGIHASPVENAWNSRIHEALQSAANDGVIEYVFSEGVSGTDYARAMREYAEQGADLIWGESYAVENEARQVAADYPDVAFEQKQYIRVRRWLSDPRGQSVDQCIPRRCEGSQS